VRKTRYSLVHMIGLVALCAISLPSAGCGSRSATTLKDSRLSVTAQSDHDLDLKVYRLPKGAFRGWECEFARDHAFRIWLIDPWSDDDVYVNIPVADGLLAFDREVTYANWKFDTLDDAAAETTTCTVSNESQNVSVHLQLPYENGRRYAITILKSSSEDYMMVFGNGSDYAKHDSDRGIFGYVVVRPKKGG
jgi:hypothetical protein